MNIIDSLFKTNNKVGDFEVDSGDIVFAIFQLSKKFGLNNTNKLTSKSHKGISIRKRGNKYVITMHMFNPPIVIKWNTPLDYNEAKKAIEEAINSSSYIAYINVFHSVGGKKIQFATA